MSINTIKTVNTIKTYTARSSSPVEISSASAFKVLSAVVGNRSVTNDSNVRIYRGDVQDPDNLLVSKKIPVNSDLIVLEQIIGFVFETGTYFLTCSGTDFDDSEVSISIGLFD